MASVDIEVTQERKHAISAVEIGDITTQQINHAAPVVLRNPVAIVQTRHRRGMNPVAIMEVVIGQAGIAAETSRIPNHSSPIIVVIEETGTLARSRKPELQLAFKTVQQIVESVRVNLLSDGKQLCDSGQLLASEICVTGSEVISLVDDVIKQTLQRRGVVVWRPRQIWQDPIEDVRGRKRIAAPDPHRPTRACIGKAGIDASRQGSILMRV